MTVRPLIPLADALVLPTGLWAAMKRGMAGNCPRCGHHTLFRQWLKPAERCQHCFLDLTPQRADDFPAYVSILLTGHFVIPIIATLSLHSDLSVPVIATLGVVLTVPTMLAILQPAKGAIIAMQWWNGMHGFRRERAEAPALPEATGSGTPRV